MPVKSSTIYTTSDGTRFLSDVKAAAHETAYLAGLVDKAYSKLKEIGFTDDAIKMAWDHNGELTAFFQAQTTYEKI